MILPQISIKGVVTIRYQKDKNDPDMLARNNVRGRGSKVMGQINPLKPELNPICYLLPLLGAHHFRHVSRIRVKLLTLM
jgi:transposase